MSSPLNLYFQVFILPGRIGLSVHWPVRRVLHRQDSKVGPKLAKMIVQMSTTPWWKRCLVGEIQIQLSVQQVDIFLIII